jgi:hypothetical protein
VFVGCGEVTKNIIEEEPSTLTVYLDLDDVKGCAKVG